MKVKTILLSIAFLGFLNVASAQGKYGADSINCLRNLQLYRDYAKQNNLQEALPFWQEAKRTCPPTASLNLYIDGARLMKYSIDITTNPILRQQRIDSLIELYTERIQYYPKNSSPVYAYKAFDMMRYTPDDPQGIYATFKQSVEAGREKTDANTMVVAMQKASELYQTGELQGEEIMNLYSTLSKYMDTQVKQSPSSDKLEAAKRDLDNVFINSGVASCDNLVAMFGERFKETPEDKDLIITIVQILGNNDCVKNDLYVNAVEAYHQIEPSAGSAYALARMYIGKEEYTKGIEYLREAIAQEPDNNAENSKYLIEIANIYFRYLNNNSNAISAIKEALQKEPKNGRAYLLQGTIWAMQKCEGGDDMDKRAVFWVAVDYFNRAKQVDSDPTVIEEANKSINIYSQYFPAQAEAFMYDLLDDNPYTVNCGGMTERTTVRTRK
jgi:tetratricopeptide (TPR) repeat protein